MSPQQFDFLENLVRPLIEVRSTHLRSAISSAERLAITLRFLATGNSFQSPSYSFRVGKSTISQLVPKVCQAMWTVLKPRFLKPLHEQSIEAIAEQLLVQVELL
ncbi:hypothetical protein MRX96_026105 [Rhipicephalus microplus]